MCMAPTITWSRLWMIDIPTRAMTYSTILLSAVITSKVYGFKIHCCLCLWFIKCIARLWTVARFWQVTIGQDWSSLLTNHLPTPCSVCVELNRVVYREDNCLPHSSYLLSFISHQSSINILPVSKLFSSICVEQEVSETMSPQDCWWVFI